MTRALPSGLRSSAWDPRTASISRSWAPAALLGALLVVQPATASDPVALEGTLASTRQELEAARIALEQAREALEEDRARHQSELAELRRELERVRQFEPRPTLGERIGYAEGVHVGPDERVQEVVAFGGDVHVEGEVAGDATAFGGNVFVADGGVVEGDAISFGGRVQVAPAGRIEGGRIQMGVPGVSPPKKASLPSTAAGSVGALAAAGLFDSLLRRLVVFLSFAGAGVLVVGLFPKRVSRTAHALEQSPIRTVLVGALGSGFLVLFSLLFAIATFGLGLPLSLLMVGLLGLAWLLGFVGLCQAVGDQLPLKEKPHGRWLAFLVGTLLITMVGSLPVVGWLVVGAASVVSIGAALSSRFGSR